MNNSDTSISNYWRMKKKNSVPLEMVQIMDAAQLMASTMGVDEAKVTWQQNSNQNQSTITLDTAALEGVIAPVPGQVVDIVMGMVVRDAAKQVYNSNLAVINTDFKPSSQMLFHYIANLSEEAFLYNQIQKKNEVLSAYMKESKKFYAPSQEEIDNTAQFLANKDNAGVERKKALVKLIDGVTNYDVVPSLGILSGYWMQNLIRIGTKAQQTTGGPSLRKKYYPSLYLMAMRAFEMEPDEENDKHEGVSNNCKFDSVGDGSMGSSAGSTPSPAMQEQVEAAQQMYADGTTDLSEDVRQALGTSGVRDEQHWLLDATAEDDATSVDKESDRLARLLEMFREMRYKRIRGEKTGKISPRRLWRAGVGDPRIFDRRVKMEDTGLAVCLVLDHSGSIGRNWKKILVPTAAGLATGTRKDIDVWACSYTDGRYGNMDGTLVKVMYRPGWKQIRTGVGVQGGTPSAVGLIAGATLLKQSRKTNKLIIHITDGLPGMIGGMGGIESCEQATQYLYSKNVKVATLFVGSSYPKERAEKAFGVTCDGVQSFAEVPKAVEEILSKVMKEITHNRILL